MLIIDGDYVVVTEKGGGKNLRKILDGRTQVSYEDANYGKCEVKSATAHREQFHGSVCGTFFCLK